MGRKQTKSGKIRLTEVAKLAGVSPITASRFFRNPEALSVSKRERVDSAVKELGYVPNLAARALASRPVSAAVSKCSAAPQVSAVE